MLSISVVSHRQAALAHDLLGDIQTHCCSSPVQVILTVNVEEPLPFSERDFGFNVIIIRNLRPKGFGTNHNAAFRHAVGEFFCVLNPDIRLVDNPFPSLLSLVSGERVGAVSPQVLSPEGNIEDHAREFPHISDILKKALPGARDRHRNPSNSVPFPDWIAGMFMLFKAETFRKIGGFDERYFLYYEDVDMCARLRAAGLDIRVDPMTRVIHHARRESHRNPGYLAWHLQSMLRFFFTRPRKLPPLP